MPLLLLLSLFITPVLASEQIDFRCDADICKIPHDSEGYKDGLEVCYTDKDLKDRGREVTWSKGQRQGPARCFKNGKLSIEAEYQGDELNGIYVHHKYDSRGSRVQVLKNGIPQGYDFMVDESGKVTSINWCYQNGHADSAELTVCLKENYGKYLPSIKAYQAEVEKKQKLDADRLARRRNGPQTTTYRSGKTRSTYTNVDGKMSGIYKAYSEDGKLLQECGYKNDLQDGKCTDYDTEGRRDLVAVYKDGVIVSSEKFYDNGKVQEKMTHEGATNKYCYTLFYDSGAKLEEYCKLMERRMYWGKYDGPYISWLENGMKNATGSYENGKEIGVWERFYDDGSVSIRLTYDKGVLVKTTEFLQFKLEHNKLRPYLHRIEREFFPDGSVKMEKEFPGHSGEEKPKVL